MAEIVKMPRLSDTMEEGTIVEWHKEVGDRVEIGELLAEIDSDKATMEFDSPEEGILLYIGPKKGETIGVDRVIAIIGEKGEDFQALLDADAAAPAKAASKAEEAPAPEPVPVAATPAPAPTPVSTPSAAPALAAVSTPKVGGNGRLLASPLAKRMAAEAGIDIGKVRGSGDEGRIIKRDIENFLSNPPAVAASADGAAPIQLPTVVGEESFEDVQLSQMRKTIAKRLAESKFGAPHFYLTMEIDMSNAMQARKSMNEVSPVKISFNDIVIKAAASALRKHPDVNVSWMNSHIRKNHHIHIGMAVAVPEGLVVPVIRFTDNKTLSHIAAETKSLAQKAHDRKLELAEMQGNTFTISNLGMMGIEEFTAIINPPDACIMAVGQIKETPVVKNGTIQVGHVMKVTLSCDHRAVDGAVGSAFLKTFKEFLEDPVRLLV